MRTVCIFFLLVLSAPVTKAQFFKSLSLSGMYLQWGYNRDWYSRSDIHLSDGASYDITIHRATAKDKPDFESFWETPLDITIPQNSFRIGFYLNKQQTHAIEINFDHAKYVMESNKIRRVSGRIGGEYFDRDTLVSASFVNLEHTDGANFYHINYVGQKALYHNKKRKLASWVYKIGAGIVIPRSNVTVMGKQLDNRYHVAGYIFSAESGLRFYPLKNFFLEATVKAGYANYLDVLTVEGGKAHHSFYYAEVIGLIGYDITFNRGRKTAPTPQHP